ncbi:hypothetical protein evm_007319 [Chilo suppressalis]|nr:hypothetical protein evm_007319 [Chilo suppressalis]
MLTCLKCAPVHWCSGLSPRVARVIARRNHTLAYTPAIKHAAHQLVFEFLTLPLLVHRRWNWNCDFTFNICTWYRNSYKMWPVFLLLSICVPDAWGHGRVWQPPSRATAWRLGYQTAPDYDDDGVNCGGLYYQWSVNGGKCGICGDAFDLREPRPHELGGVFGAGEIVGHYLPGDIISTTVELTTSHLGFWQFKICPDPFENDQECFDRHPLELESGGTVYYPRRGSVKYTLNYRLPQGLVCEHCVLQWRYTAGNNWGTCKNGTQGLGCGNQEQFGACSDISIGLATGNSIDEDLAPEYSEIPSPLLYYLKHGYFENQQGLMQLLKNKVAVRQRPQKSRLNSKYTRRKKGKKNKPRKRKKATAFRGNRM